MSTPTPETGLLWFSNCNSVDELKKEFRRLVFIHHPDKGGNVKTMQELNAEFTSRLSYLTNRASQSDASYNVQGEVNIGERYREVIEKIIHLPRIEIEICGSWIWVGGDTKPVSPTLKAAGLFWSSNKQKWYWRPSTQASVRRRQMPISWIRHHYGSAFIQQEPAQQVT